MLVSGQLLFIIVHSLLPYLFVTGVWFFEGFLEPVFGGVAYVWMGARVYACVCVHV